MAVSGNPHLIHCKVPLFQNSESRENTAQKCRASLRVKKRTNEPLHSVDVSRPYISETPWWQWWQQFVLVFGFDFATNSLSVKLPSLPPPWLA
jgi:hypothetical protein